MSSDPDYKTLLFSEANVWNAEELAELKIKEENLAEKEEKLQTKREALEELDDSAKLKVARRRIRAAFRQPLKKIERLQAYGDDISAAVKERLKKYRINRIIQAYGLEQQKFLEAIEKIKKIKESYPAMVDSLELTDENFEVLDIKNEDGDFQCLTSSGSYVLGKEFFDENEIT